MSDLADALAIADQLVAHVDASLRGSPDHAVYVVTAAARRVAEADEIWWCETHLAEGFSFCWRADYVMASRDAAQARCRMVRRPLLKPVETRKDADPSGASPVS